jgi:protein-tyrosine phosphatase
MKRRVLFLCTGNYYRSRFAEELFNHCAKLGHLSWIASSRGLALDLGTSNVGPLSVHTRDALRSRGVVPQSAERLPEACTFDDLARADLVIAMDKAEHRELLHIKYPGWQDRVIYWSIHDVNISDPLDAVALIDLQIFRLIKQLESGILSSG